MWFMQGTLQTTIKFMILNFTCYSFIIYIGCESETVEQPSFHFILL